MNYVVERIDYLPASGRSMLTVFNEKKGTSLIELSQDGKKAVITNDFGTRQKVFLDVPIDTKQINVGEEVKIETGPSGGRITHTSNEEAVKALMQKEDLRAEEKQRALNDRVSGYPNTPYYNKKVAQFKTTGSAANLPEYNHLNFPEINPKKFRQLRLIVVASETYKEFGKVKGWLLLRKESGKHPSGWIDLSQYPALLYEAWTQSTGKLAVGQCIAWEEYGAKVLLDDVVLRPRRPEYL